MKNLLIIILSVVFTSCNAQKLKSMKTFDIETFTKNKNHLNRYIDTLNNGKIIEYRETTNFYEEIIKQESSFFEKYSRFYKNGNLKLEGKYLRNDFQKGIWKEYDEQGKLIKEIDYDEDYEYSWEDLLEFLNEREIKIIDRNTTIRKDEGKWHVWYVKGIYVYNIFIDGKTGKILLDDKDIFEEGS